MANSEKIYIMALLGVFEKHVPKGAKKTPADLWGDWLNVRNPPAKVLRSYLFSSLVCFM